VGTLSLVEELSYLEVREAAATPAIDGTVDGAWADANAVTTAKEISGTGGAIATVRTLWQGQTLYVLAEVADPIVDVSGSDPWVQDSVEIFVDGGNFKNGSYRFDDTQIRINADNAVSFGTGDEAFQAGRLQSAAVRTPTGYTIEAAISLLEYGGLGTFHGLDFQVNDGTAGTRTAIRNWADPTGLGYQTTARWGVGQLVAGVERIENIAAPRILGIPLRGLPVLALPGRWSVDGVSFTFQWQRDGVDIAGADEIIYFIKKADVGKQLTVVVTAHKSGYDPVSAVSPPVRAKDWNFTQFFE
jgi:endo-1,4-beta-xylanase